MAQGRCQFLSEVKQNHAIKNETFPFYSLPLIITQKFERLFSVSVHTHAIRDNIM